MACVTGAAWLGAVTHELCQRAPHLGPQDVANSLWALATLKFMPQVQEADLKDSSTPGQSAVSGTNLGNPSSADHNAMWGTSYPVTQSESQVNLRHSEAGGQQAYGKEHRANATAKPPLVRLLVACVQQAPLMSDHQLSSVIWAAAVGGWQLPRGWLGLMVGQLQARMGPCGDSATRVGSRKQSHQQGLGIQGSAQPQGNTATAVMEQMKSQSRSGVQQGMQARDAALVLYALARLKGCIAVAPALVGGLLQSVVGGCAATARHATGPHDIMCTIWAVAELGGCVDWTLALRYIIPFHKPFVTGLDRGLSCWQAPVCHLPG
jgi:hypothetical protein